LVEPQRIRPLNRAEARRGDYVLYWMQAAPRVADNPALEHALRQADELGLPLVCVFGLTASYPEATLRHYVFLLEGLAETAADLQALGVRLAVLLEEPDGAALRLAQPAALLVTDRAYLRHQRAWRERVAAEATCPVVQVEGEAVVPVEQASGKAEWAASSLRPKLRRLLADYLPEAAAPQPAGAAPGTAPGTRARRRRWAARPPRRDSLGLRLDAPVLPPADLEGGSAAPVLGRLRPDPSVPPVAGLRGGGSQARARLARFVRGPLAEYHLARNDPAGDLQSGLSPYLHFGQISPLAIARAVAGARGVQEGAREAFLEQLVVRRELSLNLVLHDPAYDRYEGLPEWARATLGRHARDRRPYLYDRATLERAETHDPYWNAAMREALATGGMHGYLRMYWGKKILEWSPTPQQAFAVALALNNRWCLDGRDPNSYAGVAWCFGRHDRPWPERPVFGTVRSMTSGGLERKFDMDAYLRRVSGA
jgi:deoxyribodipyrimidine photo-lyase